MTVSVRRMTAGTGYRYLLQSVAVGDGHRPASTPLTRYYGEPGSPPGRWAGAGLAGLDGGRGLEPGSTVTEEQLFRLLGMALDPISQQPLGAAPKRADSAPAVEGQSGSSKAVTAFDLTMSVPKSVSAAWAIADAPTQQLIVQAHHAAIADTLAWAERHVFATRIGRGGATQVGVRGAVAACFDHYDSRANDPHLHTHVVVANRVQTAADDKWRTLDSRALFRAVVAMSELHQGLVMDRVSGLLGVGWDGRTRPRSSVVQWEITGVPDSLRVEFSRRSTDIQTGTDRLVDAYLAGHGRVPSPATVLKLRQQATLETRPDKHLHSLSELTSQWRQRAEPHIGTVGSWVRDLPRQSGAATRSHDFEVNRIQQLAEATLAAVALKRTTFTRWNVYAEAQRQLHPSRLVSSRERFELGDRVCDSALGLAMLLTPNATADLERAADTSLARPVSTARYTTHRLFDAEERLLTAARNTAGPAAPSSPDRRELARLSDEQRAAVGQILQSGRRLDVLVGAAGTGKTAAMAGLAAAWQAHLGAGSVIGLAPSASAAAVLADELKLPTENTAMWLTQADLEPKRRARLVKLRETSRLLSRGSAGARRVDGIVRILGLDIDRWRMKPGQLVIVDEASMTGTLMLDRLVQQASAANAKVLLVGDWAQLSAVDAGGAFGMLARDRPDVTELLDVRRFADDWERPASLGLRIGDPDVINEYAARGRLHDGDRSSMIENAYSAWLTDQQAGRRSLLLAADSPTVIDLNIRARRDLVLAGRVAVRGVKLSDGSTAGIGDRIITRQNDRRASTGGGWIKNGDEWLVTGQADDDALEVTAIDGPGRTRLTPDYVRNHVELGYAATAHRAEGRTVDTAHAVITGPGMTRESLYVLMTRGRESNHAWVATDFVTDPDTAHGQERLDPVELLASVLQNVGAEQSAHEVSSMARAGTPDVAQRSPVPHPVSLEVATLVVADHRNL